MNIGQTIKRIRKQKGIKQYIFAKQSNITPAYLSQIENNLKEPNLSTLNKISESLGVPLSILFFLSLDSKDVKSEKRAAFEIIAPSIKALVSEFFIEE